MIVVVIMGIMSAMAIPSYFSYRDMIRRDIAKSILSVLDRTLKIEFSLGKTATGIDRSYFSDEVWGKVDSDDRDLFVPVYNSSGSKYCVGIEGTGDKYETINGCLSGIRGTTTKHLSLSSEAQPCSTFVYTKSGQSGHIHHRGQLCPSDCRNPTGTTISRLHVGGSASCRGTALVSASDIQCSSGGECNSAAPI